MLCRATQKYVPQPPKNDLSKQLSSSSPAQNGNIEDQFKRSKGSKSIGGFMGYKNSNPPNALSARSPNIKQSMYDSGYQSQNSTRTPVPQSTGLASVLNKQSSFAMNFEDMAQHGHTLGLSNHVAVEFDENDFDDDADIDLMEEVTPKTMQAPPRPQPKTAASNQSPYALPKLPPSSKGPNSSQNHINSTATWSSSSPSHRATPPGALERRKRAAAAAEADQDSSQPPRPPKRRTLPWLQTQAEKEQLMKAEEEEAEELAALGSSGSSQVRKCISCGKAGHYKADCPALGKSKGSAFDFTPLPKNKSMPWNHTGSAIRDQKQKFKEQRKAARKPAEGDVAAMEAHHRSKRLGMAPITLSTEQKRVLDLVVNNNKSVFFTGSAGTGKSVLMRAIIQELKKKYIREPDRVAVTASTGLAACNIGGVTLHSYGGIGLGKEDVPTLVKKIKRNSKAKNRWFRTKVLIVDEISMVDGDLFDKLEGIARALRNNGRPFGGIQLVITGDFFQLPPVPEYENRARGVKFAFDAGTWPTAIHHTIGLTEVFRQKDPVFANMLNEMRLGKISNETIAAFKKLSRKIGYEHSLEATELFPTRNEVENANASRMRNLHGQSFRYEAKDTGTIADITMRDKLLANMMAPKIIELKKGAQVMLIKNIDDTLVNGSLGRVSAFMTDKKFEIIEDNPELLDEEGDDLDEAARENRNSLFAALSAKTGDSGVQYPLVDFIQTDGTIRRVLMQPEEWKVELPNGEIQAQRSQLPLILAWALSIHKAQGQTLERVKIDLKKVFEKGQAYVALSRATCQEGLEVHNFDKSKVMAHPRVAEYYNSLYSVNKALEHPTVAAAPKRAKAQEEFKKEEFVQTQGYDFEEEEREVAAYG